MARVEVLVDDLERGDLPAVCVKRGVPCANPVGITLRPGGHAWTPFAPRVHAILPMDARRARRIRVATRVSWVVLFVGLAGLVASVTGGGALAVLIAVVAFVVYAILVVAGDRWSVGARPVPGANASLVLTRVHPVFARAVDEQYGRVSR
jgi:hypothetical protein